MATHSSTRAWKIPGAEEPVRLQSVGVVKSRTRLSDFTGGYLTKLTEGTVKLPTEYLFTPLHIGVCLDIHC